MILNHLSLSVAHVAETATFITRYFDFTLLQMKGDKIAVLEGAGNFILVLTTSRPGEDPYPADFHFGFILDDTQAVTALYDRLLGDGVAISRVPAHIRSSFAFYFHMPGGIMVEISCNLP
ncbi:VOC family protein [Taibaiella koreensis]|uniref:VOC family protein n=1 Tax=Taibaiella koreensis TaxID=1268548 RepID=UPI000E59BB58|nr:VOC family protein [Taibaiella koreensis]